jgi:hypothetical protein
MVPSRVVDHQYLGSDRQGAYGLLEQGSFPEGEQGGQIAMPIASDELCDMGPIAR